MRGRICIVTHRGKKTFVLLGELTLSCEKGIWFEWKAVATGGEDDLQWEAFLARQCI